MLVPLLKHPDIPIKTKVKLTNSIVIPNLTYQCQTWTLTKSLERKVTSCGMRCLRRAVNKNRRDMIRNDRIREHQPNTTQNNRKSSGFGHLTRMTKHQMALNARWRRRWRRRRKTWIAGVKETLKTLGFPLSRHSDLLLIVSFISPRHPRHKRTDKVSKVRWNTYSGGSRISQKGGQA